MKRLTNLGAKIFLIAGILMPGICLAQVSITGRVLSLASTKPLANASVFLNNTTIGDNTTPAGTFTIHSVKPGKYALEVSVIGYEAFQEPVTVGLNDVQLPDIIISPKSIALGEVKIKYQEDPNRQAYYEMFKTEFLGSSNRAADCNIRNPDMLSFDYDDATGTLQVSSDDFLDIRNDALGYNIKYKVTRFSFKNDDINKKVFFQGPVFFKEIKGTPAQQNRWKINRQEAYENSPMHFLRAALADRISQEGFRVQQYAIYANPGRPSDGLIKQKIQFYKSLPSPTRDQKDSLSLWIKRSNLPEKLQKLTPWPLNKQDIIQPAGKPGVYRLSCDDDALYIAYNKNHHYHIDDHIAYLGNAGNTENTLVTFNGSNALFDENGIIFDLGNMVFAGVWGKNRVAEYLPYDYTPLKNEAPSGDDEPLVASLQKYLTNNPVEKAYLQFDKPYYAAGDTIYFKAYVTKGEQHKLTDLSEVLHVELINTKNKIDQTINLQLDSGIATGDFALPDSLPQGNYRVRAYTRWMRNFDETGFFDKTITIASVKAKRIPESGTRQPYSKLKPDVQFFPEGGVLLAGVRSKIAFKAIGPDGLSIAVSGEVLDDDNSQVVKFNATHLGMGYFYITPAAGKKYTVKLNYANGMQDVALLPLVMPNGIGLLVNDDSLANASVQVAATTSYFDQNNGKSYKLLIFSQGVATTIDFKLDTPAISFNILKRKLHTGVATITLFAQNEEPLCERLFFVQNYDRVVLNVSADKTVYTKREKVNIKLNALNRKDEPAEGHFSVSVIDENKVPDSENNAGNILTDLLLTSDLKGYVEQPNYYFADTGATARKDLDLLMLTQGYRRFEWRKVLDTASQTISFPVEKGISIAGRVTNLTNKPVNNGTITLLQPNGKLFLNTKTDDRGLFRFTNLVFTDSVQFVLSAVNANNKNSTKITWFNEIKDAPPVQKNTVWPMSMITDTAMNTYVENDKLQQQGLIASGKVSGVMLKQVNIHSKKYDDKYRTQSLAGAGNADQIMHAAEIEQIGGQLETSLNGRLHGVNFTPQGFPYLTGPTTKQYMLVIVDGAQHPEGYDINSIPSSQVETVEVLKYASTSIYGYAGGNGVLIITTKQGGGVDPGDIASIGVLPINPKGFYKAREFYSPKYEAAMPVDKAADLRSTIYWQPEIKTDASGSASFGFYNADGVGTYKVTVEGIDSDGNIGREVYKYEVK